MGLPDDSAGQLFYVLDAKRSFISLDAFFFYEDFTSPLNTPDLPFTGAMRLRNVKSNHNDDVVVEHTGEPTGHIQTFEDTEQMMFLLIRSLPFWQICPNQQMNHYLSWNI